MENFNYYKEELELNRFQNRIEADQYRLIANLIVQSKNGKKISLRDVSTRRKSAFADFFKGESGFPDFVIREREYSNNAALLGAVEVKYMDIDLDDKVRNLNQLEGHINSYGKVIYSNGLEWRFYENSLTPVWSVVLGHKNKGNIEWGTVADFEKLISNLDSIEWNKIVKP